MKNQKNKSTLKYQKGTNPKHKNQKNKPKNIKNDAILIIKWLIEYSINLLGLCPKPLINFEFNLINIHLTFNQTDSQRGVIVTPLGVAQTHEEIISSTFYTFATCGRSPKWYLGRIKSVRTFS